MITHFIYPEVGCLHYAACGVHGSNLLFSSRLKSITCKNCKRNKSFILESEQQSNPKILHTPTPWFAENVILRFRGNARWVVYPMSDVGFIAHCGIDDNRDLKEVEANAKHIVACVNAFAGIKPTFFVKDLIKAAADLYYDLPEETWLNEEMKIQSMKTLLCHIINTEAEKPGNPFSVCVNEGIK